MSIIISRNLCLINQFLDHHVHLKIWVRWPCIPEFLAYQSILDRMIYSKKTIKEWKYIKSKLQNLYKIHKCQWIKQTENWCSWRISDKLIWPRNLKKTSDAPGKRSEKVRTNKGNGKTESVSKSILNVNNIFFTQKYQFRRKINIFWCWHFLTALK